MHISKPAVRALLAIVGLVFVTLPIGLVTSPAQAASTGTCNTASTRNMGLSAYPHDYAKLPLDDGSWSCWMGYGHGTTTGQRRAVKALQNNILTCYPGTLAAQRIRDAGGADGHYGTGTRNALIALQRNQLGFTGDDVDGVYGAGTRQAMRWAHHSADGLLLAYPEGYYCTNPTRF